MDTTKRSEETGEPWKPGAHAQSDFPGSDAIRSVRDGLGALGNQVRCATETVQRRMAEFQEHGFDRIKDDVVKYTREQPTNALLVAAGLGVLLGILSGLRRR